MGPDRRLCDLFAIEVPIVQAPLTNVMSGRPARGIWNRALRELGLIARDAPAFPGAAAALAPLRAAAERAGSGDFTPLWAGQSAALAREVRAADLTRALASDARERMARRGGDFHAALAAVSS